MSPYWVIGIITFALYVVHRFALARAQKQHNDAWMTVALAAMVLEVQARAARDRQLAKEKAND